MKTRTVFAPPTASHPVSFVGAGVYVDEEFPFKGEHMETIKETIAASLRRRREAAGLTVKGLREAAGLDAGEAEIAAWETGEETPTVAQAALLADFYGISMDELMGRQSGPRR